MPWRFILLGTLSGFQREYLQRSAQQREKKSISILTKEMRHSQEVYLGPTQTPGWEDHFRRHRFYSHFCKIFKGQTTNS